MKFIINDQENFETNSSEHNINTRNKHHLNRPNANLSCVFFLKKAPFRWHKNFQLFTTYSDNTQEREGKT
jgi:hypothetical protein